MFSQWMFFVVHSNATTCVLSSQWVFCAVHLNATTCVLCPVGHLWTLEPLMRHTLPGNWGASHWNALLFATAVQWGALQSTMTHCTTDNNCRHRTKILWVTLQLLFQIALNLVKCIVKCEAAVRHCYRLLACSTSGFQQKPKKENSGICCFCLFVKSHISNYAPAGWKQICVMITLWSEINGLVQSASFCKKNPRIRGVSPSHSILICSWKACLERLHHHSQFSSILIWPLRGPYF